MHIFHAPRHTRVPSRAAARWTGSDRSRTTLVRKGITGSAGALGSGFFFFFFFSFLLPIPTHSGSGRGEAAAVAASVSDRCAHPACTRGFSARI